MQAFLFELGKPRARAPDGDAGGMIEAKSVEICTDLIVVSKK